MRFFFLTIRVSRDKGPSRRRRLALRIIIAALDERRRYTADIIFLRPPRRVCAHTHTLKIHLEILRYHYQLQSKNAKHHTQVHFMLFGHFTENEMNL